jgi:protein-S-isoprenylcysteine O-methyltransferase Ste14
MTILLISGFLTLQASFIWARYTRFRVQGATPRGVRVIESSTVACIALGVCLIAQRTEGEVFVDVIAVMLVLGSAVMFAWACRSVQPMQLAAAFTPDTPVELVREGAFRVVRNPFYLSYILAHAVPLAAARSPWALLPLLWMTVLYHRAAILEERQFLASTLAGEYQAYARRTGRFLPSMNIDSRG